MFRIGDTKTEEPLVLPVTEVILPRELVGGKAQGLSRLLTKGFNVPSAFCVTTNEFELAVADLIEGADNLDELVDSIREYTFPSAFRRQVSSFLDDIDADAWAVRSSAVAEDSAESSLAGQNLTELGVTGLEGVLGSIRRVWASLFDLSGLMHRERVGVEVTPQSIGVLVQKMLVPSQSGILFTSNPVEDRKDEFVIDMASASMTGAVDGKETQTFYLDKNTCDIRIESGSIGGVSTNESLLTELHKVAKQIEDEFDPLKDLEWAYCADEQQLYLLQMRDITTENVGQDTQDSVWTNTNVGEALPGVATPLTWSIIRLFSRRGFEQAFGTLGLSIPEEYELVGSFRGRIYLNVSQFMHVASGIPVMSPETLFSMAGGGGVELVRDIYEEKSVWEFFLKLPVTVPRILLSQVGIPLASKPFERLFDYFKCDVADRILPRLSKSEFEREVDKVDRIFDKTGLILLTASSNFLMSYVLMHEALELLGGERALEYEQQLVSGLDVESKEPGLALVELAYICRDSEILRDILSYESAEKIQEELLNHRTNPDVGRFVEKLGEFRVRYGHRAPREAEFATRRWREDLDFVFNAIRRYLKAAHLPTSQRRDERNFEARRKAEKFVASKIPTGLLPVFEGLLGWTRKHAELREKLRSKVVETLDLYRRVFVEVGRRMTEEGTIRRADDVFFLRYGEIRDWFDDAFSSMDARIRTLVRKKVKEAFESMPHPPRTFVRRGNEMIDEEAYLSQKRKRTSNLFENEIYRELSGIPGSPGSATGRARVVENLDENIELEPGEILVAPHTDVGWAPLFLTASAVVTGLGGPLSHSCIVAREYGVPTVVNIKNVTELIETGDLLTVDADNGEVFVRREQKA